MTLSLKYYAPAYEHHEEILRLLEEVKALHGIPYEVVYVDHAKEQEIYREVFVKRASIVARRIGGSLAKELRSRRGRGSAYIRGMIALFRNGQLEWYPSTYDQRFYNKLMTYDKDHPTTIGFLKMLKERGRELLEDILSSTKAPDVHGELLNNFIRSIKAQYPYATIETEVPVGKPLAIVNKYGEVKETGRKKVDVVVKLPSVTLVVEVEPKLSASALGQALIYRELYARDHPTENVRSVIVCQEADEELVSICKKFIDDVIVMGEVRQKEAIDWAKLYRSIRDQVLG